MKTTQPTSEVEDEVKSERSGRQQDREFQCNVHKMCDEEDNVISDTDDDDDVVFEEEDDDIYDDDDDTINEGDDELCSSFEFEQQMPGQCLATAKRCIM